MSDLETRIKADMTKLAELVKSAQVSKDATEDVTRVSKALSSFVVSVSAITDDKERRDTLLSSIPEDTQDKARSNLLLILERSMETAEMFGAVSAGAREEGDALAKGLKAGIEAGWFTEVGLTDEAEVLVSAWTASAPTKTKGTRGTGEGSKPKDVLPFPVRISCPEHGWTTRETGTLNSLRWSAVQHHAERHAQGVKPGKGDPVHVALTDAIGRVCFGDKEAEGAGYKVIPA